MKTLKKTSKAESVKSTSTKKPASSTAAAKKKPANSPAKKAVKTHAAAAQQTPANKQVTKNINKGDKKMIASAAGPSPSDFSPYREETGEEYMNKNQSEHFRDILNLWKEQLRADRDATVQHMQDDAMNFPDILDRAALEEEHKLEWQAREREHKLINKIDQALARIKLGDYGFCEVCGAEIGVRRLEARPTATQCIDCKTIDEIREKQTGIVE